MIKLDSKLFDINNIPQFRQEFDKFHELELKTKNFNVYNNSIFNDEQTAILLEHNEERDLIFLLNLAKSAYLTQLLIYEDNEKLFLQKLEEFLNVNDDDEALEDEVEDIKKNFNMNYSEKDKNKKRISYELRNSLARQDIKIISSKIRKIRKLLNNNELTEKNFYNIINVLIYKYNKINPTNAIIDDLTQNLINNNKLLGHKVIFKEEIKESDLIEISFDLYNKSYMRQQNFNINTINTPKNFDKKIQFNCNNNLLFLDISDWKNIEKEYVSNVYTKTFSLKDMKYSFKVKLDTNKILEEFNYLIFEKNKNIKEVEEITNVKLYKNGVLLEKGKDYSTEEIFAIYSKNLMEELESNIKFMKKILNVLVKFNMRLIISLAKKYLNKVKKGLDFNELKHEGLIGFINAMHKFEINSDLKISTYATWWIRQSIIQYISNNKSTIKIPLYYVKIINDYESFVETLENNRELKSKINDKEWIAEQLKISLRKLEAALYFTKNSKSVSLHQSSSEDEEYSLEDFITYKDKTTEDKIFDEQTKELIIKAIEKLNEKEKFVIMERHEVFNENPKTLNELGKKLDLTKERVRQIEVEGLKKIKKILAEYDI